MALVRAIDMSHLEKLFEAGSLTVATGSFIPSPG